MKNNQNNIIRNENNNAPNSQILLEKKDNNPKNVPIVQSIQLNQTKEKNIIKQESELNILANEAEINLLKNTKTQLNIIKEDNQLNIEKKGEKIENNYRKERVEISYEKNEFILIIDELGSEVKKKNEKVKPNKYYLVDIDDPDLYDGAIQCAQLKCVLFGILACFLNSYRLIYLIFLHLIYPLILWFVRCFKAFFCFCCFLFQKEDIIIESETKREMIDSQGSGIKIACNLCKNCGIAFKNFICNFVKCPCWFYEFIIDCLYDIKNRALDNARIGCYRYIHYDCGCYEKNVEEPFNDYMKKRSIILSTNPNDPNVIYGEACQNNIKI